MKKTLKENDKEKIVFNLEIQPNNKVDKNKKVKIDLSSAYLFSTNAIKNYFEIDSFNIHGIRELWYNTSIDNHFPSHLSEESFFGPIEIINGITVQENIKIHLLKCFTEDITAPLSKAQKIHALYCLQKYCMNYSEMKKSKVLKPNLKK